MKQLYIIVEDSEGGAFSDGTPVTISTRILFEGNNVFGIDNLMRKFHSVQEAQQFLSLIRSQPSGSYGRLSWRHDE